MDKINKEELEKAVFLAVENILNKKEKKSELNKNNYISKKRKAFPVSVSNRHVHISKKHLEILFGDNYKLNKIKDLSQPGQFAASEKVILVGPKGVIEKVRILGPERKNTQVEVSITDCFKLGIKPHVRESGALDNTPGITLCGPAGSVYIGEGVIVAGRHIHCTPVDALNLGVEDGQVVDVEIENERGGIFKNVLIRVSDNYKLDMHIDTDEGNAFMVSSNTKGIIC
ncbi:MAG: phosphate propanoyltransferase [Candidatus Muiribacteriota bacterium]